MVERDSQEEMLVFTDGTYSTCGEGDFSAGWDTEDIITHEDKKKYHLHSVYEEEGIVQTLSRVQSTFLC